MLSIINGAVLQGVTGKVVKIETHLTKGLPHYNVVGLGDIAIKEANERIRSAIINSSFQYPRGRLTVNLSPSAIRKKGTNLDLPMAIGILHTLKNFGNKDFSNVAFLGELSLDGKINQIQGVISLLVAIREKGIKTVFLPWENLEEGSLIKDMDLIGVKTLKETVNIILGKEEKKIWPKKSKEKEEFYLDYKEVKGQEYVKRAMCICAAGAHNVLLKGSPGVGKTMMAKRLPSILPPMTYEESLEVAKIYSSVGMFSSYEKLTENRPFRSINQSITKAGLLGGGTNPKPGEISLAHCGVLFIDEINNFDKSLIESLREPLEDREVVIIRKKERAVFKGDFILVASANPCKCGFWGDANKVCSCSQKEIEIYNKKLSGPFLDRMDMIIKVNRVSYDEIEKKTKGADSSYMKERVMVARNIQMIRYGKEKISFNSQLEAKQMHKYCFLGKKEKAFIKEAYEKYNLSMRSYYKIIKLARTIADLEEEENIKMEHLAEAIQYKEVANVHKGY